MLTRILVVDDDTGIRELLVEYLRGRGMEVEAAADGATAFALLAVSHPSAVITDLKLPDIDGLEVVREAARADPPIAVLATTGYGGVGEVLGAVQAGAQDLLLKPFKLRELWASLEHALARTAREREARRALDRLALLEAAEVAETPEAAEALVPALEALWPDVAEGPLLVGPPGGDRPLGTVRSVPAPPAEALPYVLAVHRALERSGR